MSKQVYIDSNGNEVLVSGTVNTADMMPMSGGDSTKVSEAIGDLSTLTTTDKSSIVGAVNEVNSGLSNTYTKTETETKIDNNFKRVATVWGTSVTLPVNRNHFLVIADNRLFVVWFAGTNELQIRSVGANTTASGTNSVTLDSVTFTRNDLRLTVTTASNDALTIIG